MEFYEIQIGSIYLTSNGAADGEFVKCEVVNWKDLLTTVTGNTRKNSDGSNDNQRYAWTAGKDFEVKVLTWIYQAQWEDLRDLLINSQETGATFSVIGTGATGDFNVTAEARLDGAFDAKEFWNGMIFEPVFRFSTV